MALVLYGIPNCDTVRKARRVLDAGGVAYRFHDHRADGVAEADLRRWCKAFGWQKVLNKASTTFRALPPEETAALDEPRAIELMREHPSLIKRPILEGDGTALIGFDPDAYGRLAGPASALTRKPS